MGFLTKRHLGQGAAASPAKWRESQTAAHQVGWNAGSFPINMS
jgi:hypothetical protein